MKSSLLQSYRPAAPTPLIPRRSAPLAYPIDALEPVLSEAARFIVEATRCADATAAQSVLAAACLAAQSHANVRTPAGKTAPLSLFFLTVAASGERKSAADHYALRPVRIVEDEERESWRHDQAQWRNHHDAWEAQRSKIKRGRGDLAFKRAALEELGREPLPPLRPERTLEDVTTEGLTKAWVHSHGALGLFTAEGSKVIDGHAMNDDARRRTAAIYSDLWDTGRADRLRAGDGHIGLRGRRLTIHLMAQPGVAASFTNAPDLLDQGLIGRFLVCEAPEQAGTRLFQAPPSPDDPRFATYCQRVAGLLRKPFRTLDGRNELDPRVLGFGAGALEIWREFHDHVEVRLGSTGELGGVKSFGGKLAEHAARLAGVLALMEDPDADEISAAVMVRAVELGDYYAAEAERLNSEARISRPLADAEKMRVWLVDGWSEPLISVADATQYGPSALRRKADVERCFRVLEEHGWLIAAGANPVKGKARGETYGIVREELP